MCETTGVLDPDVEIISEFAEQFCLAFEIDHSHGIKPVIVGKDGAFIYVYSDVPPRLGVAFCPDELPGNGWNLTIQAALHCGMKILRDCQSEAYLSFDGKDERQASLALAICGALPVQDSDAQCALMVTTITAARQRKQRQIEHQRVLKELALIRAGADLSDYCPDFLPGEHRLHL
jgi:hypothetical protein